MMTRKTWGRWAAIGAAAGVAVALSACSEVPGKSAEGPFLSKYELGVARSLSPVPVLPADPTNRVADNPEARALGQQFFFDARFSGPLVDPANIDAAAGGNGAVGTVDSPVDGQTQRVSCARCHDPAASFTDHRTAPANTTLGARYGFRNAITLFNSSYFPFVLWDGRKDSQWSEALDSCENPREMNFPRVGVAQIVRDLYAARYATVFGPLPDLTFLNVFPNFTTGQAPQYAEQGKPGDGPRSGGQPSYDGLTATQRLAVDTVFVNWGKAIEAYQRQLVSRDSAFDRFIAGDANAISDQAQRGLKTFIGKGFCINCHNGPLLSDGQFHNLGLAPDGPHAPWVDRGRIDGIPTLLADRFNGAGAFSDDPAAGAAKLATMAAEVGTAGAFRTQTLRNVATTGPYFHSGKFASLWDVVDFYNRGGDNTGFVGKEDVRLGPPLGLSETEIDEVIEFLKSLNGAPLAPILLTSPALP